MTAATTSIDIDVPAATSIEDATSIDVPPEYKRRAVAGDGGLIPVAGAPIDANAGDGGGTHTRTTGNIFEHNNMQLVFCIGQMIFFFFFLFSSAVAR